MTKVTFEGINWDAYARCYDALAALQPYQDMLQTILEYIPQETKKFLDLGCGTGTLLALVRTERKAELWGIDNSPQMLAVAQKKLVKSSVTLLQRDISSNGAWEGLYDCIVSCNVLYTLPDPLRFLRHIHRTLTKNGVAIIVSPKAGYDSGLILKAHCKDERSDDFWRDPHRSADREHMLIHEALGDSSLARDMELVARHNCQISRMQSFRFFTPSELCALVHEAGLRIHTFASTYAEQNLLVVITHKEGGRS